MKRTARRLMVASALLLSACCSPLPGSLPLMPDAGSQADMATITLSGMAKKPCPRPNPICRELPLPPDRVSRIYLEHTVGRLHTATETARSDGNTVTVKTGFDPPVETCPGPEGRSCFEFFKQGNDHYRWDRDGFHSDKVPFFGESWMPTLVWMVDNGESPHLAGITLGKPIQESAKETFLEPGQTIRGNSDHIFMLDQNVPTKPAGAVISAFDCNGTPVINPRDLFILYAGPTYRITLPDGSGQFIKVNRVAPGRREDRGYNWVGLFTLSMELALYDDNGEPGGPNDVTLFNPSIANNTMSQVVPGWTARIDYTPPPARLVAISVSAPVGTPFVICD